MTMANSLKGQRFWRPEFIFIPFLLVVLTTVVTFYKQANIPWIVLFSVPVGFALGGLLHGVKGISRKEREEQANDPYYKPKSMWIRPLWLRFFVCIIGLVGFIGMFMSAEMDTVQSLIFVLTVILFVVITFVGHWLRAIRAMRNYREAHKPKTEGQMLLERFTGHTLFAAGLTAEATQPGAKRVTPKIIDRTISDKGIPSVRIAVIRGRQTVSSYVSAAESLASAWGVRNVLVEPGDILKSAQGSATHTVWLTALDRDTLYDPNEPVIWRNDSPVDAPIADYVKNIFLGVNTLTGEEYSIDLSEKNFLIAGIPGSGKSSLGNDLIATTIQHPHVRVAIMDLKEGVEAEAWSSAVSDTLDNTAGLDDALAFLEAVERDIAGRYGRMREAGITNAWKEGFLGANEPLKILIIDEISSMFKTDTPERARLAEMFTARLQKLIEQGRAAGFVIIISTQYPVARNLPTVIREQVSDSVCLKVKSQNAVTVTLGSEFTPSQAINPVKLRGQGDAVIVNGDNPDGVRVQFAWLSKEAKKEVIDSSQIKGTRFLDDPSDVGANTLPAMSDFDEPADPELEADIESLSPTFTMDDSERTETAKPEGKLPDLTDYEPEPIVPVSAQSTEPEDELSPMTSPREAKPAEPVNEGHEKAEPKDDTQEKPLTVDEMIEQKLRSRSARDQSSKNSGWRV